MCCFNYKGWIPPHTTRCGDRPSATIRFADVFAEEFSAEQNHQRSEVRQKIRKRKNPIHCHTWNWHCPIVERCDARRYLRSGKRAVGRLCQTPWRFTETPYNTGDGLNRPCHALSSNIRLIHPPRCRRTRGKYFCAPSR